MADYRQDLRWFNLWWLIGAAMWVYILYATLTPHPTAVPGHFSDKFLHFSGYFGVTAWFAQLYQQSSFRRKKLVVFAMMGVILEFAQLLVNERSFEWADMLANCSGVIVAGALFHGRLGQVLRVFEKSILHRQHGK